MKKFVITVSLALFSIAASANELTCLDKLLPYSRYSGSHQLLRDEWNDGKEMLDAEGAKNAMSFLVNSKLLCRPNEIAIKIQAACQLIHADVNQSNVCFIFTNLGYFTLTKDNGKNINITFSKDKQFSETK